MIHQFKTAFGKNISLFSISVFSIFFLFACKGPKAVSQGADVLPDALLWKIEHKDLPEPSYLFGTIHMIPKEDFFLPNGLEEAFEKSKRVVFEIDLDDMLTWVRSWHDVLDHDKMDDIKNSESEEIRGSEYLNKWDCYGLIG